MCMLGLATRRKTTRMFTAKCVDVEDVLYCVRVAVQAPSGANRQPWQFIIVDDQTIKEKIRANCEERERRFHANTPTDLKEWFNAKNIDWRKPFLTEAPILVAIFSNQEMPYATESTWLATGYFILALEEKSLSTLTYTPSYPEEAGNVLGVPKPYRLETILPIGYSGDPKPKEERRPFNSSIHRNAWRGS
jgi:nitroreductase